MRMRAPHVWLIFLCWATCAGVSLAAEPKTTRPPPGPLVVVPPLPALVDFAATRRIPLAGVAVAPQTAKGQRGDGVVMLVSLFDGGELQQWLACIGTADLTEKEQRLKPLKENVAYSGTGRVWHYPATRAALDVVLIGPFSDRPNHENPPKETLHRVMTCDEHLAFGLDEYARAEMAYRQAKKAAGMEKVSIANSEFPLSDDALAAGRRVAAAIGYTPEKDYVRCGGRHPLASFVDSARRVRAFDAIIKQVIDEPSPWSVMKNRGISTQWDYYRFQQVAEPEMGGLPDTYQFSLRVQMNNNVMARALFAVTAPRPPLQSCGGIIGVYAEKPGDPSKRLYVRLLATRRNG